MEQSIETKTTELMGTEIDRNCRAIASLKERIQDDTAHILSNKAMVMVLETETDSLRKYLREQKEV